MIRRPHHTEDQFHRDDQLSGVDIGHFDVVLGDHGELTDRLRQAAGAVVGVVLTVGGLSEWW
jgi:hypothetical protein